MTTSVEQHLADLLYEAARVTVTELFQERHGENFYYCALVIFDPGHGVMFSAWSAEALAAASDDRSRDAMRWSYADSPYCGFGERHFESVNAQILARAEDLEHENAGDEEFDAEFALKLRAMESAMARMDADGLFGAGERRNGIVILAEDYGHPANSERVRRLNPPEAAAAWLADLEEPAWTLAVDRKTEFDPSEYRMLQAVRRAVEAGNGDIVVEHSSEAMLRLTVEGERARVVHVTGSNVAHRAVAGKGAAAVDVADLDAIMRHFLATMERWPGVGWRDSGWTQKATMQYRSGLPIG